MNDNQGSRSYSTPVVTTFSTNSKLTLKYGLLGSSPPKLAAA